MGNTSNGRATGAGNRSILKHHPLALACAAAFLLASNVSLAADPGTATDEAAKADAAADAPAAEATPKAKPGEVKELKSVKVQGIRSGIEASIDTKRGSSSIVEAISAEDIGKLPDVSIAESLARLPGLSAQRVAGRAQVISVRGLSPDFATTLLNGRELVSTGDNRSVEFDQYPSELMAGVTVYKTPDAGLVGQGLSGTIDMRTVRPLDFADGVVLLSGRWTDNSLGSAADKDGNGNRFNASWITQNSDRSFGFAIGYSHSDTPIQENQVGIYEPWAASADSGSEEFVGVPDGVFVTKGIKALRRTGDTKRDGLMATLQWRASDNWMSTLDLFHSEATQEDTANQWEANLHYNGDYPCCSWTNVTVADGTMTGGTAASVYPLVRGMYNKREDKIDAWGWNNVFSVGSVAVTADLSWSKADRKELSLENNTQLLPRLASFESLGVDFNSNDFSQIHAGLDYSDPTKLFLSNTIYGSGYGKTPRVADELWSFKLAGNLPTSSADSAWSSFDFGLNYSDRNKKKHQPEGNINLGPLGITAIGSQFQLGSVDLSFAGLGDIPAWDVPGAVDAYMTFDPNEDASYLVSKAWTVDEQITSGWFKANLDTTWGSVPVRGNFGLQVQHVDQSSDSFYWDGTQPAGQNRIPISGGKSYTDWLPSMNLAFDLHDDQMLRVALARQVARPRVDQLRSSLEYGLDNLGVPGGSGGNPLLDPWRADAFDISYEKYFSGTKGYIAAAYFYKKLNTYIFTQSKTFDFSALNALVPPDHVPQPTQDTGQFSAPYNGSGGMLQGLELTASIPFELFSESLQGFGIIANASFNDSNISIGAPENTSSVGSDNISLPGLSDRVYNFTAYYEHNGFEIRVNNRRRSDFIGEISNFDATRTLRFVEGENITDGQISYTFSGNLEGLSLLLQGTNLTNSKYHTYAGTKDRPLENIEWGRTYLLGASYKF